MAIASYVEDLTERVIAGIQGIADSLEEVGPEDLALLRSKLANLKAETKATLEVLNKQVLELLTDPTFEVLGEWQNTLAENDRLRADNVILAGKSKVEAIQAEQRATYLRQWKNQLSQAEQVAMESLLEVEIKSKNLEELQQRFAKLQTEIERLNCHVVNLTQENARLRKELDEANAMIMGKLFDKPKPTRK
jgi:uncharacterized small protein (DUF1192 family)